MLFEDVVLAIRPFGPYQKKIYFLICLVGIPASLHTMETVFLMATPDHRCAIPGLQNDTYESQGPWHDDLVSLTIPLDSDTDKLSMCKIYSHRSLSNPLDPRTDTSNCDHWVYSKEYYEKTVITQLDLVCDDQEMVARANSVLMGGQLAGSLILGAVSDMIGRKKTMMIGLLGQFAVTFATAFVSSYIAFVILRFLATFFGLGFYLAAFVAGMELVGPEQRTLAGIVIQLFWALGLFVILLLAYLLRNWLLPESPRWLVSRGRIEEASAIVRHAARVNKADVSEKVLSLQDIQDDGPQEKFWHLFTSPVLILRCLIIFFNWCVVSMVYYGLGLNVGSLSGNLFLNFLYANIAETLSYVFCLLLLNRTGRRVLHCFTMLLGGVACVAIIFPVLYGDSSVDWVTIALSMIGKFGASAAFAIIYIFSAELFPTMVRNSAIGTCSLCARVGGIASPYIASLNIFVGGDFGTALPSLVFGGLSVLAGVASLWLPETRSRQLPETIEDAKHFGRPSKGRHAYAMKDVNEDAASGTQATSENNESDTKY
ncbi:hypothetical protein BaRGS_00005746 [Batillaria attramentaria]|uniref:Major facilitator superfamily (MFS) profile domain-containing protein n=1 Tax=Batillaria attramentaria TaxID=370345 RepID=A0ABD0LU02_9CAEN